MDKDETFDPREYAEILTAEIAASHSDPSASAKISEHDLGILAVVAAQLLPHLQSIETRINYDDLPVSTAHDEFEGMNQMNCTVVGLYFAMNAPGEFVLPMRQKDEWLKHLPECPKCVAFAAFMSLLASLPSSKLVSEGGIVRAEMVKLGVISLRNPPGGGEN